MRNCQLVANLAIGDGRVKVLVGGSVEDEFLGLYAVDPEAGRRMAEEAIAGDADPIRQAFANRTLAVSCRDAGEIDRALAHLGAAMESARESTDQAVIADILATRGGTSIILGDPRSGLRDLTEAAESASGLLLATILYRRGSASFILSDLVSAVRDLEAALMIFQRHPDTPWLPRTLQMLGECEARRGHLGEAAVWLERSLEVMGDAAGYESIRLRVMQAWLTFLQGDLPGALAAFDRVGIESIDEGSLRARFTMDVATVHIAAGLLDSAIEVLTAFDPEMAPPILVAEWRSMLAQVLLSSNQAPDALTMAEHASSMLSEMGLRAQAAEAKLTALLAQVEIDPSRDAGPAAAEIAEALTGAASRAAVDAWLLAGKLAAQHGRTALSAEALTRGATYRGSTDLLVASSGWLARAYELEGSGSAGVLRACSHGLDALDEYREIMGSSEARASVTYQGSELAELTLRHAVQSPRSLFEWSERWRATVLGQRPVTPRGDVSPASAKLRASGRRIAEARAAGESTIALEEERRSLERRVRSEHHQQRAELGTGRRRFHVAELVQKVGDGAFVQLVDVDGIMHVLVVSRGRVRRVIAGDTKAALELAEAARFALRRAARTGRFAPGDLGERFQEAVLGKAVRMLPDGPVTISPTAALHGAPFALMPALKARPFSIVPSAAQWLRARDVPVPRTKRRALISGPGLLTGGAEVARLASKYPDATLLQGADATIDNAMKAIDGAKLAHLATHGTFRADSPLFSALEMADGQLSVYELERLKRAPYRTILSACDSGVLAPVGAQEVLGLASALFSLGSAGLVCSIAEVNDEATADLMMQVHASLEAKRTPAEALAAVRAAGSPVEQATAAAFVALGV